MTTATIYCCKCESEVAAELTSGSEVYPHREDLAALPFWRCRTCKGTVGCHHKTKDRFRPLGCIPTPEIRAQRQALHALIDPLFAGGLISRSALYRRIGRKLGREFHVAELRSVEECVAAFRAVKEVKDSLSRGK